MELNEIFGYGGAIIVGLVLGLIGGGGSILTVPIFVYLFALHPVTATAYSLFVVGSTSLVGTLRNVKKKNIAFKSALVFTIPAVLAVFITRNYLIPLIPETVFAIGGVEVSKGLLIMSLFAIVMILASISMIRNKKPESDMETANDTSRIKLAFQGLLVGIITGMVGAGGGFLIVPALVLLAKIPMKRAVATSLLIIAVNSLVGFSGDLLIRTIDWYFLLQFTVLSIIGIFIGIWLTKFISGQQLKKSFGWFVLVMGIVIIYKEFAN